MDTDTIRAHAEDVRCMGLKSAGQQMRNAADEIDRLNKEAEAAFSREAQLIDYC